MRSCDPLFMVTLRPPCLPAAGVEVCTPATHITAECRGHGVVPAKASIKSRPETEELTASAKYWYLFDVSLDPEVAARYPHIAFKKRWELSARTAHLLGRCDALVDVICQVPMQPEHRQKSMSVSLVKGARATTAIEGNTLSEGEVERVSDGETLPPSKEYQAKEVANILEAMQTILQEVAGDGAAALIDSELIRRFHKMVGKELGAHFDAIPGQSRNDTRVVGPYRCPDHRHVPELVNELSEWSVREFGFTSKKQGFEEAVVQAIVTHVYLEWIHPFGDGNGRTGRLLEFYILLRAGSPVIASHILANFYNDTRAEYYRQIDYAHKHNDLSAFLAYAIQGYHDGLMEVLTTLAVSQFEVAWQHLIYKTFAAQPYKKKTVFVRKRQLALAIPAGKPLKVEEIMMLTPELARAYAGLTERSLRRDLQELVEIKLLLEKGAGRFTPNVQLLAPHLARRRKRSPAN